MARSRKGGLNARRKGALARLETQYREFKKNGKDKESWCGNRYHKGRTFKAECARMEYEMANLKKKIS